MDRSIQPLGLRGSKIWLSTDPGIANDLQRCDDYGIRDELIYHCRGGFRYPLKQVGVYLKRATFTILVPP